MNKVFCLIVASLLMVTGMSAQKAEKASKAVKKAKTEIVVCTVSMHCDNCVAKIKKQLSFEKGVKDLYLNLDDKMVAVKFQPAKTDKEKLMKAIKDLGYEVSEEQSKEKLPEAWKK
ncbi:MAG: heavy-metal-associated domain-containing protein [Cytophagaceae bacterium]|jgi:copper chaperone CopZ|nr:heavy-metal-associated domain-containing protein [Cytophagaceae bacterium]